MARVSRFERRLLLRKGGTKYRKQAYADNKGCEYDHKWIARMASFYNLIMGCFKNGFPISVPKLWYNAWAFYPFFFIRKDLKVDDPIPILNHERIHVRQQRELHMLFSIPLFIMSFWYIYLLVLIPFVPTFIYLLNFLYTYALMSRKLPENLSISMVRENTCFERESVSRSMNAYYLYNRKPFAFLAYTGIKWFKNYGMK